ncbi:hypothetical protein [Bacillus bingmayongensis]|nr:hypothetical protein [Bacillus bingmayongensis]MBY0599257.1 hypothetical protein [Bacillus bingmayongensis]
MKKIIYLLVGISTAFVLTLGNATVQKETHLSIEEVVQYSHGNTGG